MTFISLQRNVGKRRISHPLTYFVRLNLIVPTSSVQTPNTECSRGKAAWQLFMRGKSIFFMWVSLSWRAVFFILSGMYVCSRYLPCVASSKSSLLLRVPPFSSTSSCALTLFPGGSLKSKAPDKFLHMWAQELRATSAPAQHWHPTPRQIPSPLPEEL